MEEDKSTVIMKKSHLITGEGVVHLILKFRSEHSFKFLDFLASLISDIRD